MNTSSWFRRIDDLLADSDVTDLCINGAQGIFVDRGTGMQSDTIQGTGASIPSEPELKNWTLEQLSRAGKSWDAKHPFVDATLPSGHRLHVAFPPVARNGILVSLRRLPTCSSTSGSRRWHQSEALYSQLVKIVRNHESLLISGATGTGKTTLASDLLSEVDPRERIIALEDTPELAPAHPHFLSLISRTANSDGAGEVTLRTLLRQTLRMRPDRLILGECRGPEVLELLQSLNTGHQGAMATLHANSPREALKRIELLCLLAGNGQLTSLAIRELLALGLQWVVQMKRHEGVRRISEIWKLEGREGDTLLMRKIELNGAKTGTLAT